MTALARRQAAAAALVLAGVVVGALALLAVVTLSPLALATWPVLWVALLAGGLALHPEPARDDVLEDR